MMSGFTHPPALSTASFGPPTCSESKPATRCTLEERSPQPKAKKVYRNGILAGSRRFGAPNDVVTDHVFPRAIMARASGGLSKADPLSVRGCIDHGLAATHLIHRSRSHRPLGLQYRRCRRMGRYRPVPEPVWHPSSSLRRRCRRGQAW